MASSKLPGRRKSDAVSTLRTPLRGGGLSSWTVLTTLLFCVTGLIAGGLLYYTYVQDREVSLTKQHFRNLETIGRNLSEETKAFEKIIEAAGVTLRHKGKLGKVKQSLRDQRCFADSFVKVTGVSNKNQEKDLRKWLDTHKPFFAFLCASSKLSEIYISLDKKPTVNVPLELFKRQNINESLKLALEEGYEFKSLEDGRLALKATPEDKSENAQRYIVTPEINGRRGLRLEKNLRPPLPECEGCKTAIDCVDCVITLHARFELQPVVEDLVRPDTFTDVIVADEKGNVIVHRADKEKSADARLEQIALLLRQESEASRSVVIKPSAGDQRTATPWEQLPLQRIVRLGESDYYLYALAVPIDSWRHEVRKIAGESGRLKLIIAGLVPVSEVMWQALTIPHGVSLTLIFLSFALTFTLPLIKLATMGPRDRLGLPDALGCMLFSMMGAALLTFTIGAWGLHTEVKATADAKLVKAANELRTNFEEEIRQLVVKLKKLRNGDGPRGDREECVVIDLSVRDHRACFGMPFPWSTPIVQTTILVEQLGHIMTLETIRRTSVITRSLQERPYIESVWKRDLLTLPSKDGVEDVSSVGFTVNPIYAWDDGEFGTMLAATVGKLPDNKASNTAAEDYVVAIRTRMKSLVDTVVPVGYGYAVIDDAGGVLYASERNRNLRENLFSETDHDVQLKSLVKSKTTSTIRVNYRGRAHVMHVSRLLEPLPWTLLVYRDTRWLDWVTDQALFFGVALFTCYSFVILLGGLFVLVIFQSVRSGKAGWMWPAQGRVHTYYNLALLNFIVMLIAVIITWNFGANHPGRVLVGAVALSATAMGITVRVLMQSQGQTVRDKQGAVGIETKWNYSVLATTAILVMAAMPAGVFLTIGFQRALSLYESYAAHTFYEQLDRRKKENAQWYRHILPEGKSEVCGVFPEPAYCISLIPTQYPQFFFENLKPNSIPPNLTAFPQPLNEKMRSLLHLWMWEPGKDLGGWITHKIENPSIAPPFNLFILNKYTPWLITIGVFAGIVAISWYMRLCEDAREKQRRIAVAIVVSTVSCVWLLISIENQNPDSLPIAVSFPIFMVFGGMVVTAATYGSQRLVCHYLFLMDFAVPLTSNRADDRLTRHVLLVVPPAKDHLENLDRLKWRVLPIPTLLVDYHETDNPWPDYVTDTCPLVIADFDHRLSERKQAVRMLNLIERLAQQPKRPILVISHRHPFDFEIVSFESSEIPVQDRSEVPSRDRWAAAFQHFLVIPYSGLHETDDQLEMVDRILQEPATLMHEVPGKPWAEWVKSRTAHLNEESETETRYALGVLRCRYEYWWADCSPSEKLALWHVATDRFLHASNSKLYPLLWKGLLKLDPDIKLYSQSWQRFVQQAADRDQLAFLKPDLKPSTWAKVSRPLLLGLLSSVVFLSVTQENVREVIIALVPVLPAFLIEIPRLLSGGLRSAITRDP